MALSAVPIIALTAIAGAKRNREADERDIRKVWQGH
jgi:hypothetical protein